MKIDNIPVVGRLNRSINALIANLIILGAICLILGIAIIFFRFVLDILVIVFLLVTAAVLFNMGRHIYVTKKKYTDWMGK